MRGDGTWRGPHVAIRVRATISQLDLVVLGTGNAEPYDPHPREGLDSLFTCLRMAEDPGRDCVLLPSSRRMTCTMLMAPMKCSSRTCRSPGVSQGHDRGEQQERILRRAGLHQLFAHRRAPARQDYGLLPRRSQTGRPVLTDVYKRFFAGEEVGIWALASYQTRWRRLRSIPTPASCTHVDGASDPEDCVAEGAGARCRLHGRDRTGPGTSSPAMSSVTSSRIQVPITGQKKWEMPSTDLPGSRGRQLVAD